MLRTRVQVTDGAPQLDALYCTVSLTSLAHESVLQQWVPYIGHSVLTRWNMFYKLTVPADVREAHSLSWDTQFIYRVHKSPFADPILTHFNVAHTLMLFL